LRRGATRWQTMTAASQTFAASEGATVNVDLTARR
jgi:hypothetical protein